MSTADDAAHPSGFGVLRTIAVYKLIKVILLLLAAYGEIRLHDQTLIAKILSWAAERPMGLEQHFITEGLKWFSGLSIERIHQLRFVTLTYAAVFAIEGIGLWMQRRWAEWLTVIVTASLIPFEVWEIYVHPTLPKVGVLLANLAIAGYLYWHVSTRHKLEAGRVPTGRRAPSPP